MTSLSDDLATWTPDTVEALYRERFAETVRLDFKEAIDVATRGARKELAKDLSAMANEDGGFIVFGLAEEDGVASGLTPFTLPDGLSELIDNVNETCLAPPIPGLRHTPIRREDGKAYYCIYVPRSEFGPHQVIVAQDYRYYRRNERSSVPMPDSEIQLRIERRVRKRREWYKWAAKHRSDLADWHLSPEVIVTCVPIGPGLRVSLTDIPGECPIDSKVLRGLWKHREPSVHGLTGCDHSSVKLQYSHHGWRISRQGGVAVRRSIGDSYGAPVLQIAPLLGMCRDTFQLASFVANLCRWSGTALLSVLVRAETSHGGLRVDTMRDYPDKLLDNFVWDDELLLSDPTEVMRWLGSVTQELYENVGRLKCPLLGGDGELLPAIVADIQRSNGPGGWTPAALKLLATAAE